ncbi:VOC family protein [Desertifilum sp. FACHB-1129]|uniref:Glyoxalase n=2 Tax=Desertifilum tharense IPPAS B-1220 TaxID=1781255 RepID=A0A1E5QCU7_9CYAN|nr:MULTISPECIES: VOC family protein [Desertifilum]MDA0209430.1 VOC family protein [Cyanobacteria bacterium FC1]MBD2314309.1 VOC family protein [Desertifilum sp. FACHB-1129]MBD2324586.1 VOC family protein [Desertifilum sp. FACHB-866]MBD2334677.1 VOC family protein [Desertifilum sp. FACHB-868]OEJ72457.1 glyoxalase [Desertifilum tharense IPPAS B-1220]
MQVLQGLHTAILVSDVVRAEVFYGKILGLEKVDRTLKYPGAWYQLGDYQIHLIEDKNLVYSLQNSEKWGRNPHFALRVNCLESAKQILLDNGYEVQMSASGRAALFTRDPDGNVIELGE